MKSKVHSKKLVQAVLKADPIVAVQKGLRIQSASLLVAALAALILGACAKPSGSDPNANGHVTKKDLSPAEKTEKAEDLVDEGEKLARPMTFNNALGKFNEAVKLDPENNRALFWQSFLKVVLESKGILTRMRPAYTKHATPERYAAFVKRSTERMTTQWLHFIKDGPEDIQTLEEMQEWMDRFSNSIFEFRKTLRKLKPSEITISLNNDLMMSWADSSSGKCRDLVFGPIHYQSLEPGCESTNSYEVGLNRADFEALLFGASAYQMFLETWTAYRYNMTAILDRIDEVNDPDEDKQAAHDRFIEDLFRATGGGKLRKKKAFGSYVDFASDTVIGLRYLLENQRELCPQGRESIENRRNYLLSFGACVSVARDETEPEASKTLRTMETFLSGGPLAFFVGEEKWEWRQRKDGGMERVRVRNGKEYSIFARKLLENPPEDLNVFRPMKVDKCGGLVSMPNTAPYDKYFVGGSIEEMIAMGVKHSTCGKIPSQGGLQ